VLEFDGIYKGLCDKLNFPLGFFSLIKNFFAEDYFADFNPHRYCSFWPI
jgi:hypothetical protein